MSERNQFGTISVLKISVGKDEPIDEIVTFLSCSCYPTDLVISSADNRFVYAIGETIEPESWCRRLNNLMDESSDEVNHDLEMVLVGMWPTHEAREAIVGLVSNQVEVKDCA